MLTCTIDGCDEKATHALRQVQAQIDNRYDKFGDLVYKADGSPIDYLCAKHTPQHVVRWTNWATPVQIPTLLEVVELEEED